MRNEQKVAPRLHTGGALSPEDARDLASRGFSLVINLLTPGEPGFDEESLAREAGLDYVSLPVSLDTLEDALVERFDAHVQRGQDTGEVAVHCKGGGRAGIMALLFLARQNHWSAEQALEAGRKWGVKLEEDSLYRPFFDDYMARLAADPDH